MASWKQSRVFGRAAKLEACSKSSEFSRLAAWAGLTHPKLDMGLACCLTSASLVKQLQWLRLQEPHWFGVSSIKTHSSCKKYGDMTNASPWHLGSRMSDVMAVRGSAAARSEPQAKNSRELACSCALLKLKRRIAEMLSGSVSCLLMLLGRESVFVLTPLRPALTKVSFLVSFCARPAALKLDLSAIGAGAGMQLEV